ncbi:DUF4062 domain-containing protein [Paenibacillus alkalitolerans]|uniref:DUF4062 domain-containing protein n=1 Tax=Paenibacillus alkalitolerans TaxID=2799335 RepID=UPI0018F342B5|nr:DUF4062 domain-containing protein [Paenibacillus alkalitolerans]
MKPRVFVSSTYYDLKHIRNSIERFIMQYGFEPVLFESGNVYFEFNQELDISCYNEVKLCHMMILIIGGRYGAPSSEEKHLEFIEGYEKNYISITRREFKEAVSNNIPIFIFIDKNVYSEYHTFKKNKDAILKLINEPDSKFNFAYVDSTNVFDFIDEVKVKALATFEKFDDIETYLRSQIASMFFNYLIDLKSQRDKKEVLNSVTELQNISNRMNEMVNEIGRKVLSETGQYEEAVKKQNEKTISMYTKKIVQLINFQEDYVFSEKERTAVFEVTQVIYDDLLNSSKLYDKKGSIREWDIIMDDLDNEVIKEVNEKLKKLKNNLQILISTNLLDILMLYKNKITPLYDNNGIESLFKETLESELEDVLWVPF